jgi:hypothetical protein
MVNYAYHKDLFLLAGWPALPETGPVQSLCNPSPHSNA